MYCMHMVPRHISRQNHSDKKIENKTISFFKNAKVESGEMVQWLRVHTAVAEGWSLGPSTRVQWFADL